MDHKDHQVIKKAKSDIIKAPKGKKASTVVAKIMFNDDEDGDTCWDAVVTWKQAKIKVMISKHNLLDLVKRVKRIVYDGLIDLMGRVQEVDVILKMPVKDHKFTVTFKEALKTVESN